MKENEAEEVMIDLVYEAVEKPVLWSNFLDDVYHTLQEIHKTSPRQNDEITPDSITLDSSKHCQIPPLLHHLGRAVRLSRKMSSLEQELSGTLGVIDNLTAGILMTDQNGTIISFNKKSKQLLSGECFLNSGEKIKFKNSLYNLKIHSIIQQISHIKIEDFLEKNISEFIIQIPTDEDKQSITLLIVPAKKNSTKIADNRAGHANIIIMPRKQECNISSSMLKSVFGLTNAESRLTQLLVQGKSIEESSNILDISIRTIRNQLSSIFKKTDVNRQSELVYTILMSPAIINNIDYLDEDDPLEYDQVSVGRKRIDRTLPLDNGRSLSYTEYGAPNGTPLLYFHSVFGSRLQQPFDIDKLLEYKIRVITIDRPGYGCSSPREKANLKEWPIEIKKLLDHLDIEKCYIASHSIGGMYAMACAYSFPERVIRLGLISSMGTFNGASCLKDMELGSRFLLMMGRHIPSSIKLFFKGVEKSLAKDVTKISTMLTNSAGQRDKEILLISKKQKWYEENLSESLRHSYIGLEHDITLAASRWCFDPLQLTSDIHIWHGSDDNMIPASLISNISALPNATTHILTGEGHLLIYEYGSEILETLISP